MNRIAWAITTLWFTALGTPSWADHAAPPSKPLTLQVVESKHKHGIDDDGNMDGGTSSRFRSTVTLALLPEGQLRLEDRGTAGDTVVGGPSYTKRDRSWKTVGRGRWTMTERQERLSRVCSGHAVWARACVSSLFA